MLPCRAWRFTIVGAHAAMHGNATKSRRIVRPHSAALAFVRTVAALAACARRPASAVAPDSPLRPWSSHGSSRRRKQPADKSALAPADREGRASSKCRPSGVPTAAMSNSRLPPVVRQVRSAWRKSAWWRWFVRLYGESRGSGRKQTPVCLMAAVTTYRKQRSASIRARWCFEKTRPCNPAGESKGRSGAYAVFENVEVWRRIRRRGPTCPPAAREWGQARHRGGPTDAQSARAAAWLIDWRSKAAAFDRARV